MQSSSSYNRILYQILTNYIVLLLCNSVTCTSIRFIRSMISDIHVLFSNNKSKVQSHTHNFFFISCTVPMAKIGSRSRFWRRAVFRCYYLVFKGQDLFLIYKNDLTRRNDLFFSVLFISCEFDSIFKKLKFEE